MVDSYTCKTDSAWGGRNRGGRPADQPMVVLADRRSARRAFATDTRPVVAESLALRCDQGGRINEDEDLPPLSTRWLQSTMMAGRGMRDLPSTGCPGQRYQL
jgi:hypothetical protein